MECAPVTDIYLEDLGTILDGFADISGFSVILMVVHSEDIGDELSLGEGVESGDVVGVFHELENMESSGVLTVADSEFCVERVDEFHSKS